MKILPACFIHKSGMHKMFTYGVNFSLHNENIACSNYAMTYDYLSLIQKAVTSKWPSKHLADSPDSISRNVHET
jgi:adenosine deaminase